MSLVDKYLEEAKQYVFSFLDKDGKVITVGAKNGFAQKASSTSAAIKIAKKNMKDFPGAKKVRLATSSGKGTTDSVGDFNLSEEVNEVMGYKMKPKDQKLIKAFIDGATSGSGKALWIEGDYLYGPMQSSTKDYVAKRDGNYISVGTAYGNVSQTWVNYIRKNTPKAFLR